MNPLEKYLAEKHGTKTAAGPLDGLRGFGQQVGRAAATGAGTAVAGAAIAGAGVAASKIWDAVTKGRDFRAMMGSSFNADLHEFLATRPKEFNESFSSLRTINPEFTKDPMIAGTYMRRMMMLRPDSAGGALIEALSHRKALPESEIGEAFLHSAGGGVMEGTKAHMREQQQATRRRPEGEHGRGGSEYFHVPSGRE